MIQFNDIRNTFAPPDKWTGRFFGHLKDIEVIFLVRGPHRCASARTTSGSAAATSAAAARRARPPAWR